VVIYAYMGLYPRTRPGALALLSAAARLARRTGAARLIVKTAAESSQIPSAEDNVLALEVAARTAGRVRPAPGPPVPTGVEAEARAIIDRVRDLDDDLGRALTSAFARGYLDVPYCLHPDNAGRARSYLDDDGRLAWAATGALPIRRTAVRSAAGGLTSAGLLRALSYMRDRYDSGVPAHA
jgi:methylaspartate mutase epsilon subunit